MGPLNSNKQTQKLIYMHILLAGEKTMCCMCDHFQSFVGRRCLSLVNFSHLMTCHISTHSHRMCARCIILLMDCFSVTLEWAGTLIQGFGAHTRSKHFGETLQNSGENKWN